MTKRLLRVIICMVMIMNLSCFVGYAYTYTETAISAHRGDSAHCPENTMAAFEAARLAGAKWIETDAHMTRDGVIVLTHDGNLLRVSGTGMSIANSTLGQIKKVDVGSHYDTKFAGEQVVTLDELLEWAKQYPDIKLNVEIKSDGYDSALMRSCADTIYRHDMKSRCALATADYSTVQAVKNYAPSIKCIYILHGGLKDSDYIYKADIISVPYDTITEDMVRKCHDQGKPVYAWTVNDPAEAQRLAAMQVDNIITDDPGVIKAVLDNSVTQQ